MYLCSDMHPDKSQMIVKKNPQTQPIKIQCCILKHWEAFGREYPWNWQNGVECENSKREICACYKDLGSSGCYAAYLFNLSRAESIVISLSIAIYR